VFSAGALGGLLNACCSGFRNGRDYGPCRDTCANQMGPAAYLLGRHLGRHLGSDVPAAMAEGFRCAEGSIVQHRSHAGSVAHSISFARHGTLGLNVSARMPLLAIVLNAVWGIGAALWVREAEIRG